MRIKIIIILNFLVGMYAISNNVSSIPVTIQVQKGASFSKTGDFNFQDTYIIPNVKIESSIVGLKTKTKGSEITLNYYIEKEKYLTGTRTGKKIKINLKYDGVPGITDGKFLKSTQSIVSGVNTTNIKAVYTMTGKEEEDTYDGDLILRVEIY